MFPPGWRIGKLAAVVLRLFPPWAQLRPVERALGGAPMKKFKAVRVPVVLKGETVGTVYLRGRRWWFDFRSLGARRKANLRTRDLEEALRKAKAEAERVPILPGGQFFKKPEAIITLGDALEALEKDQAGRNRPASVERVMDTSRRFVAFIGGPEKSPRIITRSHLISFRDHRKESGISPHTVNSDIQRVKVFVNLLRVEGLVDGDPTFKVRRLKVSSIAPEAPSPEVVGNLLEAFKGCWLYDLSLVLVNVGLRPQEALHIRACDVDAERQLLRLRPWGDFNLKDHEVRTLALNDAAACVLSRRKLAAGREGEVILFPSPAGKTFGGANYENFTRLWRERRGASKLAPYDARHFFASQAVAVGWSVERLSRYLGHSSVAVTERYYIDRRALSEVGAPPVLAAGERAAQ
jgi:integrase